MVFIIAIILFWSADSEKNRIDVSLVQCIDGDTAWFLVNDVVERVRFLSIDAPELDQPLGMMIGDYTCQRMQSAIKLKIEMDNKAYRDNYDRLLAWIWVDGDLLQLELISKGYARVAYLFDDYKYNDQLIRAEQRSKSSGLGIWGLSD